MIIALVVVSPKLSADATVESATKLGMTMGIFVFLIPAIWGGATSIALFRMKRWARISTLVFAGLLAFFGVISPVFLLVIPMPPTPGAGAATMAAIKVSIAAFYLVLAAIGIWWLIYLTRPGVKAQFEAGLIPTSGLISESPSLRPLSVTIIAWFLVISAAFLPINAILHAPALILGHVLTGWAAVLVFSLFAAISVIAGVGLLRLRRYGLSLAVAYFVFGIVNAVTSFLLPGSEARVARMMDAMPPAFHPPSTPQINFAPLSLMMIAVTLIPIFFLLKNRSAFELSPSGQTPPPPPSI